MSDRIEDGGAAFPPAVGLAPEAGLHVGPNGMSLRDYFAGQALAGLLANSGGPFQANNMNGWDIVNCTLDDVAKCSYQAADAMIAARKATGGQS